MTLTRGTIRNLAVLLTLKIRDFQELTILTRAVIRNFTVLLTCGA
jgi:hypothetical protein